MKKINFKKIVFFLIGIIACTASLFSFELCFGSLNVLTCGNTRKASYAIDALTAENNAAFVNYNFSFENSDGKRLNSRQFFNDEYDIETESVMLVTSRYSFSKVPSSNINAICDERPLNIDSTLSMTNLTFCFDFKCVLTKSRIAKTKIGISEALAKHILGKDDKSSLDESDLSALALKTISVDLDSYSLDCTIYCYYKQSSVNSFFGRYLYGNFIVFHETEIAPPHYCYSLASVSHSEQTYKVLKKMNYSKNNIDISFIDADFKNIELNEKIDNYIDGINIRNGFLFYFPLCAIGAGCFALFYFLKIKNRYLVLLSSMLVVDLIKMIVLHFSSTSFIILSLNTYYCYLPLLLFIGLLIIKKRYKNE